MKDLFRIRFFDSCSDNRKSKSGPADQKRPRRPKWVVVVAIIFTFAMCGAVAHAQTPFYQGKTITIVVGYLAGDGYDIWARLLAAHMGKHIPGRPNFTVFNQPGGGGLLAVNHAGNAAPHDGTFLTIVSQSVPVVEATGGAGLRTSLAAFK